MSGSSTDVRISGEGKVPAVGQGITDHTAATSLPPTASEQGYEDHAYKPQTHPSTETDYRNEYPAFKQRMRQLAQLGREEGARWERQAGVTGWVSDKMESATETAGEWWDWMRGAKATQYADKHVALPPLEMWNAVDQALAMADDVYAAGDQKMMRRQMHRAFEALQHCNQRMSEYLHRSAQGGDLAETAVVATAMTASTVAGFVFAGPVGSAAAAGVMRADIAATKSARNGAIDWKKVGFASAKEAASTLVFSLLVGPIAEKLFQPALSRVFGPVLTKALGSEAAGTFNAYLAGFSSGAGLSAVQNAVWLQVDRITGGVKMTDGEFVTAVIADMVRGGVQDLLFDALAHGGGHAVHAARRKPRPE